MADVTDPAIREAYDSVRDDKADINWLLLQYTTDRGDKLALAGKGSGGLEELKAALKDDQAAFGYARITYSNDKESERHKFIFITWIGSGVKVMRKAKLGVHSGDVQAVLRAFSIAVPASTLDDLAEQPIVVRLRKAGGASYDKA